jgi:hypothetical protein
MSSDETGRTVASKLIYESQHECPPLSDAWIRTIFKKKRWLWSKSSDLSQEW